MLLSVVVDAMLSSVSAAVMLEVGVKLELMVKFDVMNAEFLKYP